MEGGSFAGGVTHLKQEEMKRKKSNQTAAHSVVAALASLPEISTTGKKPVCLLLALLALLRLFHSRSTYRNVSIRTSPTSPAYFHQLPLYLSSVHFPPCCCSAMYEKVLARLAKASGSELSIKA